MTPETISVDDFEARCLDLVDRVGSRQIGRLEITRHGRVVAVLVAPASPGDAVQDLHGFMRGSVIVPDGVDLTAPVLEEPLSAAAGILHT